MNSFKVWANIKSHPVATAFMSALRAQNPLWVWTNNSAEASLWCICVDKADINRIAAYYDILANKPLVAHVSPKFNTMPYAEWVYFPMPLNVDVLNNWLASNQLAAPKKSVDDSWKHRSFKLSYWPNMSMYEHGGSEFIMACSHLLHGWCRYEQLLRYDVKQEILDVMLFDSVSEGNLIYNDGFVDEVDISDTKSSNQGMFSSLFKRIVKRFA